MITQPPTRPRTDLSALLADAGPRADFRDDVVAESLRIMQQHPGVEPEDIGVSLCVPADRHNGRRLSKIDWGLAGRLLLALALQWAAVLAMLIPNAWMWLLAIFAVTWIPIIYVTVTSRRKGRDNLARRMTRRFFSPWTPDPALRSKVVHLQNLYTFKDNRFFLDDLGALVFDPDRKRIIIEGLRYRYILHGEGLETATHYPSSVFSRGTIMLAYRVGGRTLNMIATFPEQPSPLSITGRRMADEVCDKIRHTLGLSDEPAAPLVPPLR